MNTYQHIFDSHSHYDDEAFGPDREALLTELPGKGISGVVTCGTDIPSSHNAIRLASQYSYLYAAAGIHPECVKDAPPDSLEQITGLLGKPKVVALGEIGLDYHFAENAPRQEQIELCEKQILLAKRHRLPIIFHDRDAHGDTLALLQKHRPSGVVHCFSGSVEMAREVLKLGMYLGVGGAVTFKNARVPVEVAKMIPEDRLLVETDCPYMTPVPYRGKRNDSSLIPFIAERIAEIRGMDTQLLLLQTEQNAKTLFHIPSSFA